MCSIWSLNLVICLVLCILGLGEGKKRILNGENARPGQFPHHVALMYRDGRGQSWKYFCGGSIIDKDRVVTSAKCIIRDADDPQPGNVKVIAGINKRSELQNRDAQAIEANAIFVHNCYEIFVTHDIAVIQLLHDLEYNSKVQPIDVPNDRENVYQNSRMNIVGFGNIFSGHLKKDTLQWATVPVISRSCCENILNRQWKYGRAHKKTLSKNQFCASTNTHSINKGACTGDWGGGLVADRPGRGKYLAGIISYIWVYVGREDYCDIKYAPDTHTDMSKYICWVQNPDVDWPNCQAEFGPKCKVVHPTLAPTKKPTTTTTTTTEKEKKETTTLPPDEYDTEETEDPGESATDDDGDYDGETPVPAGRAVRNFEFPAILLLLTFSIIACT